LIDPQLDARVVFPDFQTKFEQSIVLRRDLWRILQIVKSPNNRQMLILC
jgi:hypothetical protein